MNSNNKPIQYADAAPEVREVYDDIMRSRKSDDINDLWKVLAHHPATLRRVWQSVKEVMAPGSALDPLTKELIYIAVSINNSCEYCMATHTASARAKGATDDMLRELYGIIALANETNRLAIAYQIEVDERYRNS